MVDDEDGIAWGMVFDSEWMEVLRSACEVEKFELLRFRFWVFVGVVPDVETCVVR